MKYFLLLLGSLFPSISPCAQTDSSLNEGRRSDIQVVNNRAEFSLSWGIGGLWTGGNRSTTQQGYAVIGLSQEFNIVGGLSAGAGVRFYTPEPSDYSISINAGYTHWESSRTFGEYVLALYCPSLPTEPRSFTVELGSKFAAGRHTLFRLGVSFTRFSGMIEEIPATMPAAPPYGGVAIHSSPVYALGIQMGFSLAL